jgi:hypothetical protein
MFVMFNMCTWVYDVSVIYFTSTVPRVNQLPQPNRELNRSYTFPAAVILLFDIQKSVLTKAAHFINIYHHTSFLNIKLIEAIIAHLWSSFLHSVITDCRKLQ